MNMDTRSAEQIRHHYDVEKELADKLRNAPKTLRLKLYSKVYDELFRRVPNIPHLGRKDDEKYRSKEVQGQLRFLTKFLRPNHTFLEIGPGDCRLSLQVAAITARVYAVDVTNEIVKDTLFPSNVSFRISDGCDIPVPENTVDVAYSDQLIEHLHPEDADDHLRSVHKSLAPAGKYICVTPNRLYGPHDVSQHFDENATGLHLKEYTVTELAALFRKTGFGKVRIYTFTRHFSHIRVPLLLIQIVEGILGCLPRSLSLGLSCSILAKWLLRSRVIGIK